MVLTILGAALLVLGLAAVLLGWVPAEILGELAARVGPILAFLIAITIVTELFSASGLFTWLASHFRRWGRGRTWVLWLLVSAMSVSATIFLSLDTTAVLLTPIVVVLARQCRVSPLPFAFTTVWMANMASLLLPVSNLTNLLALHAKGQDSPLSFAAGMLWPAIWCVVVPLTLVLVVFRRQLRQPYTSDGPSPERAAKTSDPVLLWGSAAVLALIIPAFVSGIDVWIPASAAALVLLVLFLWRERTSLSVKLVPWPVLLFAVGLFVFMAAVGHLGLPAVTSFLAGSGTGFVDQLRVSALGAGASNLINNLPAYLALESAAGPDRLNALLVGVNAGAIITPWASLATLLWHDRLRRMNVTIRWRSYVLMGALLVPLLLVPSAFMLSL